MYGVKKKCENCYYELVLEHDGLKKITLDKDLEIRMSE